MWWERGEWGTLVYLGMANFSRDRVGADDTVFFGGEESWQVGRSLLNYTFLGHLVTQSVEGPTSAQVMILRSVGLSPGSGCVLTAQSLEPASGSVSPSFCAPQIGRAHV